MTSELNNPFDPPPRSDPVSPAPPPILSNPGFAPEPAGVPAATESHAAPAAESSQGTVALAIVMAYLGLGLALAWGIQQGRQRQIAQDKSDHDRITTDLVVSQEDDLGRFLAQSGTVSIPMLGVPGGPVTSASVAWNRELGDGRLFCDGLTKLQPPHTCQIWFTVAEGHTCVATFEAEPGQDIYRFHVDARDVDPTSIILTRGAAAEFDGIAKNDVLARGGRAAN